MAYKITKGKKTLNNKGEFVYSDNHPMEFVSAKQAQGYAIKVLRIYDTYLAPNSKRINIEPIK